ncbi:MAG TPA: hypothetical protein VKA84_25365 [Gemmatimonadaceae bacterium]|nr:hypothetical protein [Gemmatimonadaceae bacterium]
MTSGRSASIAAAVGALLLSACGRGADDARPAATDSPAAAAPSSGTAAWVEGCA